MNFGLQIFILFISILFASAFGAPVGGVLLLRKQQSDVIKELILNAQQENEEYDDMKDDDFYEGEE